jgi:hypothetical protein
MMSSLEDLAIDAYLTSIVEASAALRLRRAADGIVRLRQWARASLAESLGGVSSVNVRGKMLAKLRDVPFLVRAGQPCLRAPVGSSLPAAVNQVRSSQAVLRIRIRRIRMFLGLLDPDPLSQSYGSGSFSHQAKAVRKTP